MESNITKKQGMVAMWALLRRNRETEGALDAHLPLMQELLAAIRVTADRLHATTATMEQAVRELVGLAERSESTEARTCHRTTLAVEELDTSADHVQAAFETCADVQRSMEHILRRAEALEQRVPELSGLVQEAMQTIQQLSGVIAESNARVADMLASLGRIRAVHEAIRKISEQTSFIALNATIEAAHAGDRGRGFAVIADEVRRLADQAKDALRTSSRNFEDIRTHVDALAAIGGEAQSVSELGVAALQEIEAFFSATRVEVADMASHAKRTHEETGAAFHHLSDAERGVRKAQAAMRDAADDLVALMGENAATRHNIDRFADIARHLRATAEELSGEIAEFEGSLPGTAAAAISADLDDLKAELAGISSRVTTANMESEDVRQQLLIVKQRRALDSIWLNRADGSFVFSDPPAGLVNASQRPWFRAALSGEPYVSAPYISAQSRRRCITVSVPITDDQKVVGCIGADVYI